MHKHLLFYLLLLLLFSNELEAFKKEPWTVHKSKAMKMTKPKMTVNCENETTLHDIYADVQLWDDYHVGTPGRERYMLSVKLIHSSFWFLDPHFPHIQRPQKPYYPGKSSTSNVTGKSTTESFNNVTITGPYIIDSMKHTFDYSPEGRFTKGFGNIKTLENGCPRDLIEPVEDGLVGYSWDLSKKDDPLTPESSPILHIVNGLENRTVGFQMTRYFEDIDVIMTGFWITYGKMPPSDNCDQTLHWVPFLPYNGSGPFLRFYVDGFKVGKYEYKGHQLGNVDSDKYWLSVPTRVYKAIYKTLNIEYDSELNILTTDCFAYDTGPDWVFTINGKEFTVPAKTYVSDIWLENGKCAVLMQENQDSYLEYSLGTPFLRTYCFMFDVDNSRIGFSKAKDIQPDA